MWARGETKECAATLPDLLYRRKKYFMGMFVTSITLAIFEELYQEGHSSGEHKTWNLEPGCLKAAWNQRIKFYLAPESLTATLLVPSHLHSPSMHNVSIVHHFLLSYLRRCATLASIDQICKSSTDARLR